MKHVNEIKTALIIKNVYTETSCITKIGAKTQDSFQVDLVIDRKDATINICECKFYESNFEITKKYAQEMKIR